jgi:hypothetical protein
VLSLLILFRRKLELAPGLPLAMAALLLAFVVAPSSPKGGTFVDLRFAMMMGLLLFAGVRQPLVEPAEWPWLSEQPLSSDAQLRARYLAQWPRDFDYVLLIDAPADVQPHPALSLLYSGSYARLYRVNR